MKRVKIGVVGLNFGTNIVRDIVNGGGRSHLELVALCDLNREKVDAEAKHYGVKPVYRFDDLLEDPDIEAIGLFTGPAGRAEMIRKIIRSGRDVLTTKPFERSAEAAWDILHEAKRLGRVIHMNSPSPTLPPDLALVQEWRAKYELGRPVAARLDVTASYREVADGRWYDDPEQCPVAPIFRIGIYLINDLVRIFGEAKQVTVLSSRLFTERPTPDNAQLSVLFQNGALANVFASFCIDDGDNHRNAMTLNFDKGTIYRNAGPTREDETKRDSEMGIVVREDNRRHLAESAILSYYNPHHTYQYDKFCAAIRGEKLEHEVSIETIVAGIRIIEAMAEAEATGGVAYVKPAIPMVVG